MALSTSPRKVVPLAGGDNWEARPAAPPSVIKRVFFCGVVVESAGHGRDYSDGAWARHTRFASVVHLALDVKDLVASLGDPLIDPDLEEAARNAGYDTEAVRISPISSDTLADHASRCTARRNHIRGSEP